MNLLAPALLLGLLGLLVPVLAHLLGRDRPEERPFAGLRFLSTPSEVITRRRTLRDIPLLLLRLLILTIIVLALARPTLEHRSDVTVIAEVHDAVLLIDASRSMGLLVDGTSLFDQALDQATTVLKALPAGSRIGLLTSDPDGPRLEPTADPNRVARELQRWQAQNALPRPLATPLRNLLGNAATMLSKADEGRPRYIYAIGDRTDGGIRGLPSVTKGGIEVLPIPASSRVDLPEHRSIKSVTWAPAPDVGPNAVQIEVTIQRHNLAEVSRRDVTVELLVAGENVARSTLTMTGDTGTVRFTHMVPADDEGQPATIALLDDDPLPSDDRFYFWLSARSDTEVLVVNGAPSELRAHDEAYFLTTAVSTLSHERRIALRTVAPDQLEQALARKDAILDETDVLVLANVRAPTPTVAAAIAQRVRQGMGLWISAGDRVDADAYNERLGTLLPLRMRDAVQVGTLPGRTEARTETLAPANLSHPIFAGLDVEPGLTAARVRQIILLEPDPRRPTEIALSYSQGAPALITRTAGLGRVAVLTTTIDRDWADLPLRPGFVPMAVGTLSFLSGRESQAAQSQQRVGDSLTIPATQPVRVMNPMGEERTIPTEGGEAFIRDTWTPGHYRLSIGRSIRRLAFNVDPSESNIDGGPMEPRDTGSKRRTFVALPLWRWFVLLTAIFIATESLWRWRARLR